MEHAMLMVLRSAMLTVALALCATPALAQFDDIWRVGARVNATANDHNNLWAAGAVVAVRGTVKSDIGALGAELDVDAAAGRNLWAVGAIVSVVGQSTQNMYVAGGRVTIDAKVGGKLSAAGARVLVRRGTEVAGDTRLAGAEVVFAGSSRGAAEFAADTVQIDGRVAGNLRVRARSVSLGKGAIIDGDAVFETLDEPQIDVGATIRGRQTVTMPMRHQVDRRNVFVTLGSAVLFGVGAGLVLGLILLIAARPFVERGIEAIRSAPVRSAFVGLGVFVLVPLIASLIMVTIVGIPIGLLILLAFPLAVAIGLVLAAFGLADRILNRDRLARSGWSRFVALLVGVVILALVGLIPVLGFVVGILALLIGLGAFWQALRNRTIDRDPDRISLVSGN
jgi:cytoskeletal protein CcmA (bactofilin family)